MLSNLGLKVTIGKFIAGKLGVMARFELYNRDAIFYFPPDFAVFCYFHSELFRCNPPVFRCFLLFQNGYKSTPLCLPVGGVYDSESILS
ncbi:hypothetical protein, partial [Klebsiella pneumoniae]|uniref:hypothetical protein n=1 Tax=Klebsiella pneumoniae TaxID=573 RepID=UPI001C60A744